MILQHSDIILKELLKLLIGKHFIDEPEDGLLVFFFELLYEPHLLCGRFIFDHHLLGYFTTRVIDGVTRTVYSSGSISVITEDAGKVGILTLRRSPGKADDQPASFYRHELH